MESTCVTDREATRASHPGPAFFVYQSSLIRGISVMGVVVIHVTGLISLTDRRDWLTALLLYANSLARFAVPIFVALSGFHLSLNVRNERPIPFYRRTLRLLVIPYLAYSTLYVLITNPLNARIPATWLWATLTGTAYGHLWFIPVMVELYLLHPFLRRYYRRAGRGWWVVVGGLVVQTASGLVADIAEPSLMPRHWLRVAGVMLAFLPHMGHFLLGYLLADHADVIRRRIQERSTRIVAALVWVVTAAAIGTYRAIPFLWPDSWMAVTHPNVSLTLLAPPLAVAAFVVLAGQNLEERLLPLAKGLVQTCGLYAYGIYYVHPAILLAVSWALARGVHVEIGEPIYYAFVLPIIVVSSALAVRYLAKLPFTRYLA